MHNTSCNLPLDQMANPRFCLKILSHKTVDLTLSLWQNELVSCAPVVLGALGEGQVS